jgi:hypothetical protein
VANRRFFTIVFFTTGFYYVFSLSFFVDILLAMDTAKNIICLLFYHHSIYLSFMSVKMQVEDVEEEDEGDEGDTRKWLTGGGRTKCGVSKPFDEQEPKYQQNLRHKVLQQLQHILSDIQMDHREDIQELLDYLSKSLIGESKETVDCQTALQSQIHNLINLGDRNDVIRLLTHTNDGSFNTDVLALLPDFAKRSATLLEQIGKKRKRRSDYIDLQFVSDYMHDYCRYCIHTVNFANLPY